MTIVFVTLVGKAGAADWPTVRGNAQRTGYTSDCVPGPWQLVWVAEFPEETIATRVEAIVAGGRVYVGTLQGAVWAVDRNTGHMQWRRNGFGPIMHSPAWADGRLFVCDARHGLTALDGATGRILWQFSTGRGGAVCSPLVWQGVVYVGARSGEFYALDGASGQVRWRFATGGPIRCTAAADEHMVVVGSDDMHVYAFEPLSGKLLWKSAKLAGQSFRDYYPVLTGQWIFMRSVIVEEVNDDLNGGTAFLQRMAGVPGGWRELEQFWNEGRWRVEPERIRSEQQAILQRLDENPFRRTFFILDRHRGSEPVHAPILYAAGNQGCGVPPVTTGSGDVLVVYRTVYSNWNLGVKPGVGLGKLDPATGVIEPIWHRHGNRLPWNTFWGTSDESTNFSVGGQLLYLCHQGTLACLDLETRELQRIHGERDTWGGFLAPGWVANEWHGPARGSCAISDHQLFWVTGSRVLCLAGRDFPASGLPLPVPRADRPANAETGIPRPPSPSPTVSRRFVRQLVETPPAGCGRRLTEPDQALVGELERATRELLDGHPWAPFYLQMGIGSRDFYFAHPSYLVEALAWAIPYLPEGLAEQARRLARSQLELAVQSAALPLDKGRRRELFDVPPHNLSWSYYPNWPVVSHLYPVWLYAERTGDWQAIEELWPRIEPLAANPPPVAWDEKQQAHLYMNRAAAGYFALARLARRFGTVQQQELIEERLCELLNRIVGHWHSQAATARDILAREYHRGDISGNPVRKLYYHLNNHKSKLAIFMDMTPEVAAVLGDYVPEAVTELEKVVDRFMPTFYLAFEERPVHYGENFTELPDTVHGLFLSKAFLWKRSNWLPLYVDIPWVRADLFYVEKLAIALEHGESMP